MKLYLTLMFILSSIPLQGIRAQRMVSEWEVNKKGKLVCRVSRAEKDATRDDYDNGSSSCREQARPLRYKWGTDPNGGKSCYAIYTKDGSRLYNGKSVDSIHCYLKSVAEYILWM